MISNIDILKIIEEKLRKKIGQSYSTQIDKPSQKIFPNSHSYSQKDRQLAEGTHFYQEAIDIGDELSIEFFENGSQAEVNYSVIFREVTSEYEGEHTETFKTLKGYMKVGSHGDIIDDEYY